MVNEKEIQTLENHHHFQLYKRHSLTLAEGSGCVVKDANGKEYIDALAGIAVNALGHCHPGVVEAIREQATKLIHVSNLYYNEPQSRLAGLLTEVSPFDRVFFCNSGAEAMEGALKFARKYAHQRGKKGNILSMENCFHGRTIATIAMGKEKYQKGFGPMPGGFQQIPFNDPEALEKTVNKKTIAVVIEPVQGEGGINVAERSFLQKARELCDHYDALLIFDEIQCGMGRTGHLFAFREYGIIPDMVTLAKALGSGYPIGAVLAKENLAGVMKYGEHGTTFGGGPLASAAAYATLQTILSENLPQHAAETGKYALTQLQQETTGWKAIKEIRGKGLMLGIDLNFKGAEVVNKMIEKGVLANCTMNTTIRLVPPLIITKKEIDKVLNTLIESIKETEQHVRD